MTTEQFVEKVRNAGFKVMQRGEEYRAQCPAHQGQDLNLSIASGEGGRVLCTCHSHHCTAEEIARAVGASVRDLMPDAAGINGAGLGKEQAAYPYRNEAGQLLYSVGRFGGKEFRQWREGARGERRWGLGEVRRVLFGLPELLATAPGDTVAIVEGEKDAIAVASLGIAATTNAMGAGKWRQEYTDWLKQHLPDRKFVILPDNDQPGIDHADAVCASLKRVGLDCRVVGVPGIAPKGDVSDWIAGGGTAAALAELIEPPRHPLTARVVSGSELTSLELPTPEVLVPNLVYRGFSTLLAGDSKLGKSSLLLRMILAMAFGGWWLDRDRRSENRLPVSRVLFLNFEDPLFLTRQRAERMCAPEPLPDNFLTMEPPYGFSLADVIAWLPEAKERFDLDAVVLDPIAVAAEWEREEDNAEVALTFKALQRAAAETQLAVLTAHHVSKKPGQFGLNIRGASAIKANVLGYLVLEREKETIRLAGINKLTGEWDVSLGRSEDDYSWWIEESRSGNTRTPQQIAKEEAKADIFLFLGGEPGATTERLQQITGLADSTLRSYLVEMEAQELIFAHDLPREAGQPGRARKGWFRFGEGEPS